MACVEVVVYKVQILNWKINVHCANKKMLQEVVDSTTLQLSNEYRKVTRSHVTTDYSSTMLTTLD